MEEDTRKAPSKADHLCVLVHGLWGNPNHLGFVAESLRNKYGHEKLVVLAVKRNIGSLTYDGIERGGERTVQEIEETLEELARDGYEIRKLSVAGYSLGGLVARYAVGLLHSRGWFDKLQPVNFTTFATPHLGVRTPLKGYANSIWNGLGARTLSMSGRQLFTIDKFRDTERPLLSVLADPDSIFIQALAKFKSRCLYANVVNDRSAPYYTTSISRSDPYTQMDRLKINFYNEYEPVILDPVMPVEPLSEEELPSFYQRAYGRSQSFFSRLPFAMAFAFFVPIGSLIFILNSFIQTVRSNKRIRLHEIDDNLGFRAYRVPLMVQDVRRAVEDAFENVNAAQNQEYLPQGTEEVVHGRAEGHPGMDFHDKSSEPSTLEKTPSDSDSSREPAKPRAADFPTLALTPAQFAMIKALDDVGFKKYPVWIHQSNHSHAAIIVRSTTRKSFEEGKIVVKHWLEEEFQI
ncbi:MAG: hypothetical protein Q9227_003813 [Pyrenula ochraceoflavens]